MSEDLTPDQLAELVVTARHGGSGAPRARRAASTHGARARRVRTLDFSRPMKLSPPEVKRFAGTHARFCRDAAIRLSSELRSPVELAVIDVDQLTWAAAMREAATPAILAVVTIEPGGGSILLCVPEPLMLVMIERLLGGVPDATPAPRSLSEIDAALGRRVFDVLVESLSAAWSEFLGLRLGLASVEPQHANVELGPPSEATLVVTIEGRDQSGTSGTIALLIPYSSISPAAARLAGKSQGGEETAPRAGGGAMRTAIGAIGVELRAEVGAKMLTLGEVLALGVGDVLRLGPTGTEGLFGGGERLHRIRPGRAGNRRAVQIVDPEAPR